MHEALNLATKPDCLINIEGYSFVHNFCTDKTGGGVGIYIRKEFTSKIRRDISYFNTDIYESIFLETSANIIVGTIYRPPGTGISEFVNKLNEMTVKDFPRAEALLPYGRF